MEFSDDTTLKTQNAAQIYPKLAECRGAARKYRLPTNWNKVDILVKKHDNDIRKVKKITPYGFREIQFTNCTTLFGQK